jgi:hypothetical protein
MGFKLNMTLNKSPPRRAFSLEVLDNNPEKGIAPGFGFLPKRLCRSAEGRTSAFGSGVGPVRVLPTSNQTGMSGFELTLDRAVLDDATGHSHRSRPLMSLNWLFKRAGICTTRLNKSTVSTKNTKK